MATHKLGAVLGTADEFQALVRKTRQIGVWERRYADLAPPALARSSRVAGFRAGTLVLWADNAAVAAKLKQLTPSLMTGLNRLANEVTSIRVQVQPARVTRQREKKRALSGLPPQAVARFAELSAQVPESPLKHAIERLVAHHRRGGPVK